MTLLLILVIVLLLCLIALLWYGVRTHKTLAALQAKVQRRLDELSDDMRRNAADAVKAARDRLQSGQK